MKRISLLTPIFLIACGGQGFEVAPTTETMLQDEAGVPLSTLTPNPMPEAGTPTMVAPVAEAGAPEAALPMPPKAEASLPDPPTMLPEAAAPMVDAGMPVMAMEAAAPVAEASAPFVEASSPPPMVSFTGACVNDLSGVGNGNFKLVVTFNVSTVAPAGLTSIIDQRKLCSGSNFWELMATFDANHTFTVSAYTDDTNGNYTSLTDSTPVVDSGLHTITLTRINGTMYLTTDTLPTVSATAMASFGSLAPLLEKTSVCIGVDGTKPLSGTVDSVCIQTM